MFFGPRHGPARMILSLIGVAVLGLLSFVVFNLNARLDAQERANQQSLAASRAIVEVNDKLTLRLAQLDKLADSVELAVDETESLTPLLIQLRDAIGPAAAAVSDGTAGAEQSNDKLATIKGVLEQVRGRVVPLVGSAEEFGDQGKQLVAILRGLVTDLEAAVAAAERINDSLPL
ncbi:hypothetical protein [Saccharopolyspora mangrovi]|uniref:Methyl-accepting chemotaxis protein n=1 Tax=Saccharopolyspora mangrovi TaxID=3082379 RepID=A0ABU6AIU9_9PSEU|nr:hypothetical protein [Saccharopolyspora sp. S2-29]MEB3371356.1 hypothetical protein [Saccharopolyspora sp. S2-29]